MRAHFGVEAVFGVLVVSSLLPGQAEFTESNRTHWTSESYRSHLFEYSQLADLDRDGDLEFLALDNVLRVHPYEQSATFGPAVTPMLSRSGATAVTLGDVNGDGDLDLYNPLYWPAGLPGNAAPELLFGGPGITFVNVSATHLPQSAVLALCAAAEFCDVDGDGDLDLVLGRSDLAGPSPVLRNDGTGRFTEDPQLAIDTTLIGGSVHQIQEADFDGDGDPDLLITAARSVGILPASAIYLNDGTGRFSLAQRLDPVANLHYRVLIGDVDRDRDPDLLLVGPWGPSVLLNDGSGQVAPDVPRIQLPTGQTASMATLADFDDDGDPDIVAALDPVRSHPNGGFEAWGQWVNDGAGFFTLANAALIPPAPWSNVRRTVPVFHGDIDGDGDLDLVIGETSDQATFQGSVLWNTRRHLDAPDFADLGRAYDLDVRADPGEIVAPLISFGPALFDLGEFGVLRLDPSLAVPLPVAIAPASRGVRYTLQLSRDPILIGLEIYSQVVFVEPSAPPVPRLGAMFRDEVGP